MEEQNFDVAADLYDEVFTMSEIGQFQRQRVYFWLNHAGLLSSAIKIFEINSGTGYDAEQFYYLGHQVTATDGSHKMIHQAKAKRDSNIEFLHLNFNEVTGHPKLKDADMLFSNFGGLNCINKLDLELFINTIASQQKKGVCIAFVLMPRKCLMETLYFLMQGRFSMLFRRNTNKKVGVNVHGVSIPTYYHSPKEVLAILAKNYQIKLLKPVAVFLPPSYMETFFKKKKWLLLTLYKLEKIFGHLSALASWSDHYIVIAERK